MNKQLQSVLYLTYISFLHKKKTHVCLSQVQSSIFSLVLMQNGRGLNGIWAWSENFRTRAMHAIISFAPTVFNIFLHLCYCSIQGMLRELHTMFYSSSMQLALYYSHHDSISYACCSYTNYCC